VVSPQRIMARLRMVRQHMEVHQLASWPEWAKHRYLRDWQSQTSYKAFVETGTYRGDTTMAVCDCFERCFTIEYDRTLAQAAAERFAATPHVRVLQGSSATLLPLILRQIDEPVVFWLDAHYCGGVTARSPTDPPLFPELDAIFAHPVKEHVILVDDARSFTGAYNYPTMKQVARHVGRNSAYQMRVAMDIIHIYRELT
jgi:hypothetical protein